MKAFKYIFQLILVSLVITSCTKDYSETPLVPPSYKGEPSNITVAELREEYKDLADRSAVEVRSNYILGGVVTANDISGNVFKQIFIQDEDGAGINISIDQSSLYTYFHVGQELYIDLKGLSIVRYGGQLQIGDEKGQANRIAWEVFKKHYSLHKYPDVEKAEVTKVTKISSLTDAQINTLVRFEKVKFENAGKNFFVDPSGKQTTEEKFKVGKEDVTVTVRTSSYANGLKGIKLPKGTGTLTGVLGKYGSTWQFTIRDVSDIGEFKEDDTVEPEPQPEPGTNETFYSETFEGIQGLVNNKVLVSAATGFDAAAPVVYSDPKGTAEIRKTNAMNLHVWFKSAADATFVIDNIPVTTTSTEPLTLSYQLAANLFLGNENPPVESADMASMQVKVNGQAITVPSLIVKNANNEGNVFKTIELKIPVAATYKVEFFMPGADNKGGFRLDNIKIEGKK